MFWLFVFGTVLVLVIALFICLCFCFGKFVIIQKLSKGKRWKRRLISFGVLTLISVLIYFLLGLVNTMIIIIHLGVIMLLSDGILKLIKIIHDRRTGTCTKENTETNTEKNIETNTEKKITKKVYWPGIVAIAVTTVYLVCGWILAHNVWEKNYNLETAKDVEKLRVVQIADSHIGTTFDGEGFAKELEKIQAVNPDVVVITGDFADNGTSVEDMKKSCEALSGLKTKYGVYYVFGNHDKGYISEHDPSNSLRDYVEFLEMNNIRVLMDEAVEIGGGYCIVGRKDKIESLRGKGRKEISALLSEVDSSLYTIVLDHQPNDYDNEAKAQADLVLSGHTHGGQLLPLTEIGEWLGQNDNTYGLEVRDKTTFIVTSGISDWEMGFKTGCKSEFVVIDIRKSSK